MSTRYNTTLEYYENKYGERVHKICVDGGFTCPNRDGSKGYGGCIFCGERGSGEKLTPLKIQEQIKNYLTSYKIERANKFIVYFQNFSGTYASIDHLKKIYDSCLIDHRIVGINIGTRPDCISEDIAKLLSDLNQKIDITIELGLQTSNEQIGEIINRKYTNNDFSNAVKILNKHNIDVIAHIMIGLPNETFKDIIDTTNFINKHKLLGLKIHSTYVIEGTKLGDLYKSQQYTPISLDYYIKNLAYVINNISSNLILFRIVADAPKNLLLAPEWNAHKKLTLNAINKYFEENDVFQGKDFK